ncbi:MAG: GEVED domain-containing protein [Candidatus Eisenbacteria bacterium]
MKKLIVLAVIMSLAIPAAADWNPEDPAKWVQFPDLAPTGIDVNASFPYYILADDFPCTETGPITDVHIWGSWYHDYLPFDVDPNAVSFILSIHEDIPAGTDGIDYSRPGNVLWYKYFDGAAGEFQARVWEAGINEGWMEPPDSYEFPGDHVCWQYNFFMDEAQAFIQQGTELEPVVYWLDVQATPHDGEAWFGWKTSLDHWNDDAVWGTGEEPYLGPWYELIYPEDHVMLGQSIDLAFVITGGDQVDELDWGDAPDPSYPTYAANLGANHAIVAGVFMGASIDAEVDGLPDPNALGDDNTGIDDEDGVNFLTPFTPGGTANVDITTSAGGFIDAWIDWNGDGSWAGEQVLTSFPHSGGTVTVPIAVPASAVPGLTTYARFRYSTVGGLSETGWAPDGEVEDYEVLIVEEEVWKWIQRPDLDITGIDVNATLPFILADDWECTEPGRVDEIHIWGSWLGDYLPFGGDPVAVKFTLSIHRDIPADPPEFYSRPGELLWARDFAPGEFLVGIWAENIAEGWLNPPDVYTFPADWTCWHYIFNMPPEEAFHQIGMPDQPVVYWLDLQAEPLDIDASFGWKTSTDHWNDDAVWGTGQEPYVGPWYELIYPDGHAWEFESIDLAFALRSNYGTGVDQTIPERSGLHQNVPNPFNPNTTIQYEVPAGGCDVSIEVYDVGGRLVRSLIDGFEPEGRREVVWDGRDDSGHELSSGVYFYKLVTPETEMTRKMLLVK